MDRVARLIGPALEAMGFELVRVRLTGGSRPVLQVMAERPDGTMTVDDCAMVSQAVSALLDVEDPISGAYMLEVSSPGIDRPLVRLADYERFAGFEARIETREPVAGRRRFKGRLAGIRGDVVRLALESGDGEPGAAKQGEPKELEIPFAAILTAKLVLTDELIAAALKQRN